MCHSACIDGKFLQCVAKVRQQCVLFMREVEKSKEGLYYIMSSCQCCLVTDLSLSCILMHRSPNFLPSVMLSAKKFVIFAALKNATDFVRFY